MLPNDFEACASITCWPDKMLARLRKRANDADPRLRLGLTWVAFKTVELFACVRY